MCIFFFFFKIFLADTHCSPEQVRDSSLSQQRRVKNKWICAFARLCAFMAYTGRFFFTLR